ncbi:MAG: DUF5654 family protein [Candidatus Falkowbacteria bacterium]|nr:DUF5654 family protein [Candidatus Falkowbacteria bacterium]
MSKKNKNKNKKEVLVTDDKADKLLLEILDKVNVLATAAFGVVSALAWNEAIKATFTYFFPQPQNNIIAQFSYAILITIITVALAIFLAKSINKVKDRIK